MKTLIINACRTGSTTLYNNLLKERKCKGYFNPWATGEEDGILWSLESFVVKCGVMYNPIRLIEGGSKVYFLQQQVNWFKELAEKFDEVILLSRKNTTAHIESFMHLITHSTPDQYEAAIKGDPFAHTSTSQWVYNKDDYDKDTISRAHIDISDQNKVLRMLSKQLNIPLSFYEDYFDPNGPNRYRKTKDKTLI